MTLRELLQTPGTVEALDRVADPIRQRVVPLLERNPRVTGVLRGRWLGHPVHPMLVTTPVGAWTAAVTLETVRRDHVAARRLIALGVAVVPLAVLTGWADWAHRDRDDRRAGIVHAAGNTAATLAMVASLRQRRRGRTGRGQWYSALGLTLAAASGALGGHIAFAGDDGAVSRSESV